MNKIEIQNLSKSFGKHQVLSNINLVVEEKDIYGVLGLSGAGKSTLVRCINGLETFDDGKILFNGDLLASPSHKVDRKNKRKIAMIFQSFNLLQQSTVLQNVEFALNINKKDIIKKETEQDLSIKEIIKNRSIEALSRVGLSDKLDAYPSSLSGGQCQRVAIARAIVTDPEVLLSDEATSALDPDTTQSILELLKELNRDLGLTIIMISHQMNVIESICNKVAILDKSGIVEEGLLSEVFLSPKADISKKLIYSSHINTKIKNVKTMRLLFKGNSDKPVLASIIKDLGIDISVIYADTKNIGGKIFGQLVIERPNEEDTTRLLKYLKDKKISFEEVIE